MPQTSTLHTSERVDSRKSAYVKPLGTNVIAWALLTVVVAAVLALKFFQL